MGWRETIRGFCDPCLNGIDQLSLKVEQFNPSDILGWVQLVTSIIGVLWIVYQFNKLRADSEHALQEYLKRHLDKKRQSHQDERVRTLQRFDRAASLGPPNAFRLVLAKAAALLVRLRRYVPLTKPTPPVTLALLLADAGSSDEAQKQFSSWGSELLKQAKLYEEEAQAKRFEAGNAFIYAGKLATAVGDDEAAREALERVLKDIDPSDFDARELACENFRRLGHLEAAREEADKLYKVAKRHGNRKRMARACRLRAAIHLTGGSPVLARRALEEAIRIEKLDVNHLGLGETFERLGDLHADRQPPAKKAARDNYGAAGERYKMADDTASVQRVAIKLEQLDPQQLGETWLSAYCHRLSLMFTKLAERSRDRARTTEA